MLGHSHSIENAGSKPEARYAYYRRCQAFRRSGEQCRAPAEKGAPICYAHARQRAIGERRTRERRAVLEEAARRMKCTHVAFPPFAAFEVRGNGRVQAAKDGAPSGFEPGRICLDANAIQVTIAVIAQALIEGRIYTKTAGRLCWELQAVAKLYGVARPPGGKSAIRPRMI